MAQIYNVTSGGGLIVTNSTVPTGNTISNTTSELAFAECQPIISPSMWHIGRIMSLQVSGLFSTAIVVPSITGKIKLNSTTIGDTGAIANAGSLTNKLWNGWVDITVLTVGASGTIEVQGCITFQTTAGIITLPIVNMAPITIDMTINQTLSLTSTWSTLSTSNSITLRQFILEL